jgi:hypothetical protein
VVKRGCFPMAKRLKGYAQQPWILQLSGEYFSGLIEA